MKIALKCIGNGEQTTCCNDAFHCTNHFLGTNPIIIKLPSLIGSRRIELRLFICVEGDHREQPHNHRMVIIVINKITYVLCSLPGCCESATNSNTYINVKYINKAIRYSDRVTSQCDANLTYQTERPLRKNRSIPVSSKRNYLIVTFLNAKCISMFSIF